MKVRIVNGDAIIYMLWCPGCDELHQIDNQWTFNGDTERPTFGPSILVSGPGLPERCHSFLVDGIWQFLSDCTHALAGQYVPMVDLPDWLAGE